MRGRVGSSSALENEMSLPKIAIVGAGPGGLVLARILHIQEIVATVLEREVLFSARSQGGSLDIHADSGQIALGSAGLTAEFRRIARYEDQESRVYDKHGKLHLQEEDVTGKDRPETDRKHLRQMLLDSLPAGTVRWGTHVAGVVPQADGGCTVRLADGTTERFDLVVGADGTWSKVRPVLSDAQPKYTGVLFLEFGIDDVDARYPDTAKMAGRGLTFALGDSKALGAHRDANAHIGGYAGLRVAEDWFEVNGLDAMTDETVRSRVAQEYVGWSEELLRWIYRSDGRMVPRGIYELPHGHRWDHQPGITLLGDAAHVMSPFGGDGANLAMLDAADLAAVLVRGDWREALPQFEEAMCSRAAEPAASAGRAIQDVFSEDGLQHLLEQMRAHQG
jgi:2-polyprenyl-6-methoxyphenol hydroxylase-like FAD-dependent oxidoreductase